MGLQAAAVLGHGGGGVPGFFVREGQGERDSEVFRSEGLSLLQVNYGLSRLFDLKVCLTQGIEEIDVIGFGPGSLSEGLPGRFSCSALPEDGAVSDLEEGLGGGVLHRLAKGFGGSDPLAGTLLQAAEEVPGAGTVGVVQDGIIRWFGRDGPVGMPAGAFKVASVLIGPGKIKFAQREEIEVVAGGKRKGSLENDHGGSFEQVEVGEKLRQFDRPAVDDGELSMLVDEEAGGKGERTFPGKDLAVEDGEETKAVGVCHSNLERELRLPDQLLGIAEIGFASVIADGLDGERERSQILRLERSMVIGKVFQFGDTGRAPTGPEIDQGGPSTGVAGIVFLQRTGEVDVSENWSGNPLGENDASLLCWRGGGE